jgi:RimJ/RimL family protein N-acetyltransferase
MIHTSVYIKGEKVVLRDVTEQDIKDIYYWTYEAPDREHLNWNAPYHKRSYMSFEEFLNTQWKSKLEEVKQNKVRSKLIIEADEQLIGTVGWYWVDQTTNWLNNGISIFNKDYWSGGYGTDAFQLWTDYIFEHMNVERVGISTWSGNVRMMKLAAKIGMIEEGRIRRARIVNGEYFDSIKMGILRHEWEEMRIKNI